MSQRPTDRVTRDAREQRHKSKRNQTKPNELVNRRVGALMMGKVRNKCRKCRGAGHWANAVRSEEHERMRGQAHSTRERGARGTNNSGTNTIHQSRRTALLLADRTLLISDASPTGARNTQKNDHVETADQKEPHWRPRTDERKTRMETRPNNTSQLVAYPHRQTAPHRSGPAALSSGDYIETFTHDREHTQRTDAIRE